MSVYMHTHIFPSSFPGSSNSPMSVNKLIVHILVSQYHFPKEPKILQKMVGSRKLKVKDEPEIHCCVRE